ncbi:MAG: hypothetical protein HYV41_03345 [Candidatus Magasanikbacteria bacterium]|nr:hypothetical protein [Candidatus Magasanikbacteria bacterium]
MDKLTGKFIFFTFFLILYFYGFFFLATPIYAIKTLNDATPALKKVSGQTGITEESVPSVVGNALQAALYISGLLFFLFIVYAGIVWMTARGKDERIEKARNTMIGATIGMVILVASYGITNLIQTRVITGPSGGGVNPFGPNEAGDQPLGCCLDWVGDPDNCSLSDWGDCVDQSIPAARWTTYADCEYFGLKSTTGDHGGPKSEGNWLWFSSEEGWNFAKCEEKKNSY